MEHSAQGQTCFTFFDEEGFRTRKDDRYTILLPLLTLFLSIVELIGVDNVH